MQRKLGYTLGTGIVALFLVIGTGRVAGAQGTEILKHPAAGDSLNPAVDLDIENAIAQCEQLIKNYPSSDFTPNVMFQLMELYYRRASNDYQSRMEKYESDLAKYDAGALKSEPSVPRVSFGPIISIGYQLIDRFPTAPFIDKILYRLALCHLQEGNTEQAEKYFTKLATEYQSSQYYDEANFRLGEQYFDQRRYGEAIAYYSKLLNSWDSAFFAMSLYKLGWSYYNIDDFPKAISTFVFLIDDLGRVEKADKAALGKQTSDLRAEAVRYVAECFAEFGGAKKAEEFLRDEGEKAYSQDLFIDLAKIYEARNDYDESNEAYAALLRLWPLYDQAPEIQVRIIENYIRLDEPKLAERAREDLVATYGPNSTWLIKHPEGEAREKALKLAEENLYILGTDAQATAMKSREKRDFSLAIARYQELLDKFPESANAGKVQYYQAECYYELADYANAAKAYEAVVFGFPKSEYAAAAAFNRVITTFKLVSAPATEADSSTFYIEDFLGKGEIQPVRIPSPSFGQMLLACNDFARFYQDDEKLSEVMMKYGEALFNLGTYHLAREAYLTVVEKAKNSPFTLQAYNMIAQCAFKMDDYLTAEKWYSRITQEFADSARYVDKAETMIASAKFKLAETLRADDKHEYAAEAFENIANDTRNPEIAERALLESSAEYEKVGNKLKAVSLLESIHTRFPNSPKVDETLFKAAVLAEELPDFPRAAEDYLELVRLRPKSVYASRALFNAALSYEQVQNGAKSAEIYLQYANTFEDDPDRTLEALCKAGNYALEQNNQPQAVAHFSAVLDRYSRFIAAGRAVSEYSAAEAQFRLAEIYYKQYAQIALVEPIQKNLKRKQALFEQVIRASQNAAKYKVADWTTAALYQIGSAYEEFGLAFLNSPKPIGLTEEQLKMYENQLDARVRPLKEKALDTYRQNIRMADENNIKNSWIEKSRERAEQLTVQMGFSNSVMPNKAAQDVAGKTRINDK